MTEKNIQDIVVFSMCQKLFLSPRQLPPPPPPPSAEWGRHEAMVDPPSMNPYDDGWYKDEETRCLIPVMFPTGVKPAPDMVLK